jgi:prepilin-type N-terminal cleavage/methylation domain-containing protein
MNTTHPISSKIKMKSSRVQSGFTLIEMMVSVSIFLIVMTIVLGALLSIIDGNKKTQSINSVANNLNAALESFTRDIKTGYNYRCSPVGSNVETITDLTSISINSCDPLTALSIGQRLTFVSTISGSPRIVQYWLQENAGIDTKGIVKRFCPANITDTALCPGEYHTAVITSPEIDVRQMDLYAKVPYPGQDQPGVFIVIKGTAFINKTQSSDFSVQTFISQRLLNI